MPGIHAVAFKKDLRCIRARTTYFFNEGVNIIAGDQGAGKSTLIEVLRSYGATPKIRSNFYRSVSMGAADVAATVTVIHHGGVFALTGYDFERDSARMSSTFQDDILSQVDAMHSSHGQASMRHLRSIALAARQSEHALCVVLDEPDANLSPRSCYEIVRIFREMATLGCQVIAAAHNPILVTGTIPGDDTPGWDEVLSMEHGRRMSPAEFLASQAMPALTDGAAKIASVRVHTATS